MLWFKMKVRVSDEQIRKYIIGGALVVDVRTLQEYAKKHISGIVNLPLVSVVKSIKSITDDKSVVILCHCDSGVRSAMAASQLRRAGYKQSFNMGSMKRAASILLLRE